LRATAGWIGLKHLIQQSTLDERFYELPDIPARSHDSFITQELSNPSGPAFAILSKFIGHSIPLKSGQASTHR
jgi:hypothetical protein